MAVNVQLYETIVTAATKPMPSIKQKCWLLCVVLMLLSKNNSTGVLIVQTVILLAVLAILIVVLVELVKSRKRNEADAYLQNKL